jgi:hypothetical protein
MMKPHKYPQHLNPASEWCIGTDVDVAWSCLEAEVTRLRHALESVASLVRDWPNRNAAEVIGYIHIILEENK